MAAPSGGGGGGGPVGFANSFVGPQEALELVGDHCYGYGKGASTASSSADLTLLSFTTGNYYSVMDYVGFVNTETSTTRTCFVEIFMNDALIFEGKYNNPQDMRDDQPLQLIIPAYTQLEFKVGMETGGSQWSAIMTGRIYR